MISIRLRRRLVAGTSITSALLCAAAAAQPATTPAAQQTSSETEQPGDIVVTARRTEERLQDVPISITVFNQKQISDRNIVTASDLAAYTPSLTANSRFGPDKSSFTIRGFNQESNTSPTVGVYFADVVSPRSAAGTASGNGAGPGSFFDLQNVQVLKGPQGTLFGRNTTGGAVLLVPRKPTGRLEGYVEGSFGNYDMRRVQAVLNAPLADTVRIRVGVDHQTRDGYLHNRSGIGPKDFGDVDYTAVRASVVGDLTPDLENYTIASYSKSRTNGILFRLVGCQRDPALRTSRGPVTAPLGCAQLDRQAARGDGFYDVENVTPDPLNSLEQWQLINTTTWKASDALTIKNIASYGQFMERVRYSIGGENFALTTGANAGLRFSNTILNYAPGGDTSEQSTFTEELQAQGKAFDSRLNWQAGGYLEISDPQGQGNTSYSQTYLPCTDVFRLQCTSVITGISGLSLVYNKVAFRNIGFYGQGTFALSSKLSLTGGLRYTIDRTTASGQRIQVTFPTPNNPVGTCANPQLSTGRPTLNPADCQSAVIVQKSSRPTWLIDAEYKPIEDLLLYAKYTRGYRQGSVNPSIIGLETWKPEKVDTYEAGVKTTLTDRLKGFFNVAAFYNDFRDQQLAATATGRVAGISGTQVIVNAGKSRIYGIEVDGSITPFRGFQLDAAYAYLNTKLQEFSAPPFPATAPYNPPIAPRVGGDLPLSPHHRVTLTGTYTLPLAESIGRISVGATYTYTSTQVANDTSAFGVLPSSKVVNLNATWASVVGLPIDLSAFVTNLTKAEFPLNVAGNWSSSNFESVVTNLPRMYGVRLRYRFGS